MERRTFKSTLEVSTNIALLLAAVGVLGFLAIAFFVKPPPPGLSVGLEKGKVFGKVNSINYASREETLLIALNTNCSYCQESLPLYRKVLDSNSQGSRQLQIVALFPNKAEEVAKYVRENQLIVATVSEVDFGPLRLSGTPTIILVDNNGVVKDFWIGKLDDHEADQFVRSLTAENRRQQ